MEGNKKKGKLEPINQGSSNLLNNLVNCRITLGGAQGLVNQILKQELQPSRGRYRILDQEIESFSRI